MLVGLKFEPSDALLVGLLYARVSGALHPGGHHMVKECDLYGGKEPWEIWEFYGGDNNLQQTATTQDLYVFTQLKKKTSKGSRINRSVGKGIWKGEDAGQPITYSPLSSEKPVGFRKRFRYEEGHGAAKRVGGGGWIMHEYSLDSWLQKKDDGYVLCRLRKNQRDQKK